MDRVTLIQCTDSKRDHASRAGELYDESRYFRKMRAWAQARGNPWYILSAKHGLVHPMSVIEPYNERGLSKQQANDIADELVGLGVTTVDVTAGMDYTDPLVPVLERQGMTVTNHFAGERIGDRERLLVESTERLRNDS